MANKKTNIFMVILILLVIFILIQTQKPKELEQGVKLKFYDKDFNLIQSTPLFAVITECEEGIIPCQPTGVSFEGVRYVEWEVIIENTGSITLNDIELSHPGFFGADTPPATAQPFTSALDLTILPTLSPGQIYTWDLCGNTPSPSCTLDIDTYVVSGEERTYHFALAVRSHRFPALGGTLVTLKVVEDVAGVTLTLVYIPQ